MAVGKKFVGDPDVWEIVDAKLYLDLDNKIKATIESPTARIGYQPKDLYLVSSISELKQKMKGAAWFCL